MQQPSPSQPPKHNLTANNSKKNQADKQQRLARALRNNLLRRKAGSKSSVSDDSQGDAP